MTQLPDHRDRKDRQRLQPRGAVPELVPTKLPAARREGDRHRVEPRGESQAAAYIKLPEQRHSDAEVQEIRRREAMRVRPPLAHIQSQMAPRPLVALGYLMALAGGIVPVFLEKEWEHAVQARWACLGAGGLAVVVAIFIALKKPRSRHHAAFLAIGALLVIVFGILQLIPQPNAP